MNTCICILNDLSKKNKIKYFKKIYHILNTNSNTNTNNQNTLTYYNDWLKKHKLIDVNISN